MNQPYLYDPQANVLRQRAEMKEPKNYSATLKSRQERYAAYLASLPAYTPVSGWVPEVGKEYVLNEHFKLEVAGPDETGFVVAVPIQQNQEEPVATMSDIPTVIYLQTVEDGEELPTSFKKLNQENVTWCRDKINERDIRYVLATERTFTLADMIECWEAGKNMPDGHYWKKKYFSSKGIDLP